MSELCGYEKATKNPQKPTKSDIFYSVFKGDSLERYVNSYVELTLFKPLGGFILRKTFAFFDKLRTPAILKLTVWLTNTNVNHFHMKKPTGWQMQPRAFKRSWSFSYCWIQVSECRNLQDSQKITFSGRSSDLLSTARVVSTGRKPNFGLCQSSTRYEHGVCLSTTFRLKTRFGFQCVPFKISSSALLIVPTFQSRSVRTCYVTRSASMPLKRVYRLFHSNECSDTTESKRQ